MIEYIYLWVTYLIIFYLGYWMGKRRERKKGDEEE